LKKPLILVVREFDEFTRLLNKNGSEVINFPAIKTLPIEDGSELLKRIDSLKNYDGLFFTSPKAAEVFLQNFENKKEGDFRGKVYILGKRTKILFENSNFEIAFRADVNTAEEFINSFGMREFAGRRFLFLRGDKSLRAIPELLNGRAIIDEVVVYQTVENSIDENSFSEIGDKIRGGEIKWICFFSPSGVESFIRKFGKTLLNNIKIAAIGTTTAKKTIENNLTVEFISSKANAEDFAFELIEYIKNFE